MALYTILNYTFFILTIGNYNIKAVHFKEGFSHVIHLGKKNFQSLKSFHFQVLREFVLEKGFILLTLFCIYCKIASKSLARISASFVTSFWMSEYVRTKDVFRQSFMAVIASTTACEGRYAGDCKAFNLSSTFTICFSSPSLSFREFTSVQIYG